MTRRSRTGTTGHMFAACERYPFVREFGLWDWPLDLESYEAEANKKSYHIYNTQAEETIRRYFDKRAVTSQ